ncbi:MAG TPA: helix-turn-helix transcriptional regulator [Stellaceae bacterium]|nr:helix-turn-helix transcriptional regulator [Stellaceae bacterium]
MQKNSDSRIPSPIDQHVGARVRFRRESSGMSQSELGVAVGITYQQVQKYERGLNRIGASRLLEIASVLNVPVAFFFEDDDPTKMAVLQPASGGDPFELEETNELLTAYFQIKDANVRRRFRELGTELAAVLTRGKSS